MFTNLTTLNLSNCFDFDPKVVMEGVKSSSKLKMIVLINCVQFTEQQLVEMLTSLTDLEYVDCTGTQEMMFCNCLYIICSLLRLRKINVEPKYIVFEKGDWQRIVRKFHFIQFGHSIMRMIPQKY